MIKTPIVANYENFEKISESMRETVSRSCLYRYESIRIVSETGVWSTYCKVSYSIPSTAKQKDKRKVLGEKYYLQKNTWKKRIQGLK